MQVHDHVQVSRSSASFRRSNLLAMTGWYGENRLLVIGINPDQARFPALLIHKKDDEIVCLDKQILEGEKALQGWLAKRPALPVMIVLDSDQAVSAMVSDDEQDPIRAVLKVKVTNTDDFCVQYMQINEEKHVTICRKLVAAKALSLSGKSQSRVVHLCLGLPAAIFSSNSSIEEPWIAAFVAADYVLNNENTPTKGLEEVDRQRFILNRQNNFFKLSILATILVLVGLGAMNLWNMQMKETIEESAILQSSNAKLLNQIVSNREELRTQVTLIEQGQNPLMQPQGHSVLIDQIASLCPREVRFSNLNLPPGKKDWKRLGLEGTPADGLIVGFSENSLALTRFIESLRDVPRVTNLTLLKGDYDRREAQYPFTLTFDLL